MLSDWVTPNPVGDVAETVVYYGSHSPSTVAAAELVARSMSGAVVMGYEPSQVTNGAQVTVVTGTQFAVNAPSPPAGAPSAGGSTTTPPSASQSTTTTTAPTIAPTASIAAPSAATSELQPWDPRSCPAGSQPAAPVPNAT